MNSVLCPAVGKEPVPAYVISWYGAIPYKLKEARPRYYVDSSKQSTGDAITSAEIRLQRHTRGIRLVHLVDAFCLYSWPSSFACCWPTVKTSDLRYIVTALHCITLLCWGINLYSHYERSSWTPPKFLNQNYKSLRYKSESRTRTSYNEWSWICLTDLTAIVHLSNIPLEARHHIRKNEPMPVALLNRYFTRIGKELRV